MSLQTRPVTLPELAALEQMFLFKPRDADHLEALRETLAAMNPLGNEAKTPDDPDPLAPRDRFLMLALNADEQACLEGAVDVYDNEYAPGLAEFCRLAIINQAATIHRLGAVMHVGSGYHSSEYYRSDYRVGVVPPEARGARRAVETVTTGESDNDGAVESPPIDYDDAMDRAFCILRHLSAEERVKAVAALAESFKKGPDPTEAELLTIIRELGPDYLAEKLRAAQWALHRHKQVARENRNTVEAPSAELAVAR